MDWLFGRGGLLRIPLRLVMFVDLGLDMILCPAVVICPPSPPPLPLGGALSDFVHPQAGPEMESGGVPRDPLGREGGKVEVIEFIAAEATSASPYV